MTETKPSYDVVQFALFGDDPALPAGLTPQQYLVARIVASDHASRYNAARLTFLAWWEAGLSERLSPATRKIVLDFLDQDPGGLNPEGFVRRYRELIAMNLFVPTDEELERRQRVARRGPPRR